MSEEQITKEKEKSSFNPKLIILGLVLFILGGALTFGVSAFLAPDSETTAKKETKEAPRGPLIEAGEFTVNIANPEGRRFLKTAIHLEVKDEASQTLVEAQLPIIKDKIIAVLTSKTLADLEVYNRDNLKQELLNQINSALGGSDSVQNIYFTNFIMQ